VVTFDEQQWSLSDERGHQGQSGSSAADRAGFQRLVADVSLGKAGIVLGLECSRPARNSPATMPTGIDCCSCVRSTPH
jgi:DNA invertase Pin-like site-specific DNA recombinase